MGDNLANRNWRTTEHTRIQNRREDKKLAMKLEEKSGFILAHQTEMKSVTREQKRIQRELDKIKRGDYVKRLPNGLLVKASSVKGTPNEIFLLENSQGLPYQASPRMGRRQVDDYSANRDPLSSPRSPRRYGPRESVDDLELLPIPDSQRQRRNSYIQLKNDEDMKNVQDRIKNFTEKVDMWKQELDGDNVDGKRPANSAIERVGNLADNLDRPETPRTARKKLANIAEIDIKAAKENITKRLASTTIRESAKSPVPFDSSKTVTESSCKSNGIAGEDQCNLSTNLAEHTGHFSANGFTDNSDHVRPKSHEVRASLHRGHSSDEIVFDADMYNPDGSLRMVHRMGNADDRFREAKKARYLRTREALERERELTLGEIFRKENKRTT